MRVQWSLWLLVLVAGIFQGAPAHATEVVELGVAPGIIATARYQRGENDKPAILLLHGWLQTRDFYTIARLFDTLAGSGYTILAPNLSLGINRRKESLPCESIHTNSIDTDIAEIEQWVSWLSDRTNQPLVLIGHSMGAAELIAFLEKYRGERIVQSIQISLSPIGVADWPENHANASDQQRAEEAVAAGDGGLSEYGLSYCKKYVTTAHNLLTFYRWDFERINSAISRLQIPTQIIIGSSDHLIDIARIQKLVSAKVQVDIIDGAGHFFDKAYEFELHDTVESHLPDSP